jgi:membrane protein implicated in regulation of membrane protease activity
MVPLQIPGGPELLIVGFIFLVFVAILLGVVGVIVYLARRGSTTSSPEKERIAELEQRVAELEEEFEAELDRRDDPGE